MENYMMVSDMPLAVTLSTLGFRLENIDRTDSARAQFCFKREDDLDEAVGRFWRGELRVEPKALLLNHKLLKSRLYSMS